MSTTPHTYLSELYLMYFIVPLWILAGVADWICHRRAAIERTSGPKESMLHLLMLAEMGIPVLAGLFLEVNALIFGLMITAFFFHEATALWDVTFASKWRRITPVEQHIHSFLEMLPLMAISIMALIHWGQFAALFGGGSELPDFTLRFKTTPLPSHYVLLLMAAIAVFELMPYAQELWRTWHCRMQRGKPRDELGSSGHSAHRQ